MLSLPNDLLTNQFRLTTESGVPVSTSDRTAQSTIYLTPHIGDLISIYSGLGDRWETVRSAEVSLALSSLTSGKNYDVFAYQSGTGIALELSAAWTNDTTRADAIAIQNGRSVKSADKTRLLVGTIRTTGTTTTEDSGGGSTTQVGGKRFVWNQHNQVPRYLNVIDTTNSWSYTTNTVRQANAQTGNKVEYVTGDVATRLRAIAMGVIFVHTSNTAAAKVGVGIDSTSTFSGFVQGGYNQDTTGLNGQNAGSYAPITGNYHGYPGLGYHAINWLEKGGDGTCLFLGDNGGDGQQTGLHAEILA